MSSPWNTHASNAASSITTSGDATPRAAGFGGRSASHRLRHRFTDESLATASPARVLIMAYERIDRDLAGALLALEAGDLARSSDLLCHAQALVTELDGMLDRERWEHAETLSSLYRFFGELLVRANITKRSDLVVSARALIADLGEAFGQAAASRPPGASARPAAG